MIGAVSYVRARVIRQRRYAIMWHGMYLNEFMCWQRDPFGWSSRERRDRMLQIKEAEMLSDGWRGIRLRTRSFVFKSVDGFDHISV